MQSHAWPAVGRAGPRAAQAPCWAAAPHTSFWAAGVQQPSGAAVSPRPAEVHYQRVNLPRNDASVSSTVELPVDALFRRRKGEGRSHGGGPSSISLGSGQDVSPTSSGTFGRMVSRQPVYEQPPFAVQCKASEEVSYGRSDPRMPTAAHSLIVPTASQRQIPNQAVSQPCETRAYIPVRGRDAADAGVGGDRSARLHSPVQMASPEVERFPATLDDDVRRQVNLQRRSQDREVDTQPVMPRAQRSPRSPTADLPDGDESPVNGESPEFRKRKGEGRSSGGGPSSISFAGDCPSAGSTNGHRSGRRQVSNQVRRMVSAAPRETEAEISAPSQQRPVKPQTSRASRLSSAPPPGAYANDQWDCVQTSNGAPPVPSTWMSGMNGSDRNGHSAKQEKPQASMQEVLAENRRLLSELSDARLELDEYRRRYGPL